MWKWILRKWFWIWSDGGFLKTHRRNSSNYFQIRSCLQRKTRWNTYSKVAFSGQTFPKTFTKRALTFLIVSPKATVGATIWVGIIMQTLHRQCLNFPQTFRLQQLQCTINVKQPFENTRPRWIVGRVKSSRVSFSRLTLRTQKKDKISWIQKVSNKGFCCLSYFFS